MVMDYSVIFNKTVLNEGNMLASNSQFFAMLNAAAQDVSTGTSADIDNYNYAINSNATLSSMTYTIDQGMKTIHTQ